MKQDRLDFIEALFDDGDKIPFGDTLKTCNKPIDPIPYFLNTDAERFAINPFDKWRNTDNLTSIVNLLFEIDEDEWGNKVDEETQEKLFLDSGVPFTTMVSSGNKSVHVIVRFTEPFLFNSEKDKQSEEQERWWFSIAEALKKHGIIADVRARLLTQISRVPGSIRKDTGKVQTLKHIRNRVSQSEMIEWLTENGVEIPPKKVYVPREFNPEWNNVDDLTKWERAVRWTERKNGAYSSYMTTGCYDWLLKCGMNCYKNELSINQAVNFAIQNYGSQYSGTSGSGPVEKPIGAGWKWLEKKN